MLRLRLPAALAILLLTLCALAAPTLALADDWVVVKLRGGVLQLVDGQWAPLKRGDVVSDDRVLRTMQNGRAELQRDEEVVAIGPSSQIQIHDKAGKRFTTVQQYFGTVEIDAEALNVQHFAVQTPYLAAVVKGTHFKVATSTKGSSVAVQRGHVAVSDDRSGLSTLLSKGEAVKVGEDGSFVVDGKGAAAPAIVDKTGKSVSTTTSGDQAAATVTIDADGKVVVATPEVVSGKVEVKNGVSVDAKLGGDDGLKLGVNLGKSSDRGHGDDDEDDDEDEHHNNSGKNGHEDIAVSLGGDNGLHLGLGLGH